MIEPGFSNGTMRMHRNASLAFARPTYLAKDFNQKLKNEERVDERNDKAHCFPDFKSLQTWSDSIALEIFAFNTDQTGRFALHSFSFDFASWICSFENAGFVSIRPMILPARLRLRQ